MEQNTNTNQSEKIESFLNWLTDEGLDLNSQKIEMKESEYGFGTYAKDDIQAEDIMVEIPYKFILCLDAARRSKVSILLEPETEENPFNQPHTILVMLLMYEITNSSSFWKFYLDILPNNYNLPMTWNKENRQMLLGTSIYEDIRLTRKQIKESWKSLIYPTILKHDDIFSSSIHTFSLYEWALYSVYSRAYSLEGYTADVPCLVPFADMINHSPNPISANNDENDQNKDKEKEDQNLEGIADYFYDSESKTFKIISKKNWKKNEQVYISYGKKSNGLLLQSYGFINPSSESFNLIIPSISPMCTNSDSQKINFLHSKLLLLPEEENPDDNQSFESLYLQPQQIELYRYIKKYFLKEDDTIGMHYSLDHESFELCPGEVPWDLLKCLRINFMDISNLENLTEISEVEEPFSYQNEKTVYEEIVSVTSSMMTSYATTVQQDTDILKNNDLDPLKKLIVSYRQEEKLFLDSVLDTFQSALENFDETFEKEEEQEKNENSSADDSMDEGMNEGMDGSMDEGIDHRINTKENVNENETENEKTETSMHIEEDTKVHTTDSGSTGPDSTGPGSTGPDSTGPNSTGRGSTDPILSQTPFPNSQKK